MARRVWIERIEANENNWDIEADTGQMSAGVEIGVHPRRINETVLGKRRITADTALRLARFFGT